MPEKQYRVLLSFRQKDPKTGLFDSYEPGGTFTGIPGSPLVEKLLVGDVNNGPLIAEKATEKKQAPKSPEPASTEEN